MIDDDPHDRSPTEPGTVFGRAAQPKISLPQSGVDTDTDRGSDLFGGTQRARHHRQLRR